MSSSGYVSLAFLVRLRRKTIVPGSLPAKQSLRPFWSFCRACSGVSGLSSSDLMFSLQMLTFSEPLRQSSRCDFDAEAVPDRHDPGTDDLPMVVREHFQLPSNQRFHSLKCRSSLVESFLAS